MKRVLTADVHLRPESADVVFNILDRVLEIAKQHRCDDVSILGDLWHVRYAVPVDLLNRFRAWTGRVTDAGLTLTMLAGNHDQIDVSGQNALQVFARDGVLPVSSPMLIGPGAWLPYTQKIDAMVAAAAGMSVAGANIAYVHHGAEGARMNNGIVAVTGDGIPPAALSSYRVAFFGHWHLHQQIGNIVYVGSPWQTTASEAGQDKGVVVVDEKTVKWSFVPLDIGQRHFKAGIDNADAVIAKVRRGDIVRVTEQMPDGVRAHFNDAVRERGGEVIFDAPKAEFAPRLGLAASAPLRAHAVRFLEQHPDLDDAKRAKLLTVFDELASRTGAA